MEYDEDLSRFVRDLPSGSDSSGRYLVMYDGACYFCVYTANFLRRIDFLRHFSFLTLQEYSGKNNAKIPYTLLQESIHVIDRKSGVMWNSTKAIAKVLLRSPPAFPLVLLLMVLRFIHVAEPAYRWVAQSRYAISSRLTR